MAKLLGEYVRNGAGESVSPVNLAGKTLGFYFSAHWCPVSLPKLRKYYKLRSLSYFFFSFPSFPFLPFLPSSYQPFIPLFSFNIYLFPVPRFPFPVFRSPLPFTLYPLPFILSPFPCFFSPFFCYSLVEGLPLNWWIGLKISKKKVAIKTTLKLSSFLRTVTKSRFRNTMPRWVVFTPSTMRTVI